MLDLIFKTLTTSSLPMIGMPGWGKTPACIITMMGLARYRSKCNGGKVEPGYRIAPDFDFSRGEAGIPEVPCIHDAPCQGRGAKPSAGTALSFFFYKKRREE